MSSSVSPSSPTGPPRRTTQTVPFLVLIGVVLGVGALFYQVIKPLVLPLFLAGVIALLAHPLHLWLTNRLKGRASLSAGLMTFLVIVLLIGPVGTAISLAVVELRSGLEQVRESLAAGDDLRTALVADLDPRIAAIVERAEGLIPIDSEQVREWAVRLGAESGQQLYERSLVLLGSLPGRVLSLFMFIIGLYFFLRDGAGMVRGWEQLTPLNAEHDRLIRDEFVRVCRGVVWGTMAAALVQAALLGVGIFIIDQVSGSGIGGWTFLLTLLTAAVSMIPFLGAASVWIPTALFLFVTGHPVAAGILVVYGMLIVSLADNLVKVLVIGERANMHPLLVFVSVFGGLQLLGFLGIFIGPVVAAVLFALLRILRREIVAMNRPGLA